MTAMDAQRHLTNLSPYFLPREPNPGGFQTRRLIRHGFLSNRWGLGHYRPPLTSPLSSQNSSEMPRGKFTAPKGLRTDARPVDEIESRLDRNFGVLRLELHSIADNVRRLGKAVEKLSSQLSEGGGRIPDRLFGGMMVERMEEAHEAEKANLETKYRVDNEKLQAQLKKVELDLQFATMRASVTTAELNEARLEKNTYTNHVHGVRGSEDSDKVLREAFLALRQSVQAFARGSGLHLGSLPETSNTADTLFDPPACNRANAHQRRLRVMAKVFHLLFRRILRPSLRIFGVHTFLISDAHRAISASEAQLRSLEKELESQNVDKTTLGAWVATTVDTTAPLRDIPGNVEGVTQEIFEALSPVIRFAFSRNADKVKLQIAAICEEAVRLKLQMRRRPGNYKIEVPSRDAKKWGEPGCDEETRSLGSGLWLQVIDREIDQGTAMKHGHVAPAGGRPGKDIACIPFGALTKLEEGSSGTTRKVILEKGWVIARGHGQEQKRKASTSAAQEEPPNKKRPSPNRGVSLAQLNRIRALMGDDSE